MTDILAELESAAAKKWRGDPDCQQAGLFARAAAELRALRALSESRLQQMQADRAQALRWRDAALAQRGEPVAWLVDANGAQELTFIPPRGDWSNVPGFTVTPLYAAPQQRKPLSDYTLERMWLQRDCIAAIQSGDIMGQLRAFARAVEAAHGIKEAE
jgi:hypothetical protein